MPSISLHPLRKWTTAQVFPSTRVQRCWVHQTANVLNNLPKSQQGQAKSALHEIYRAETKAEAHKAFDRFIKSDDAKYPKAVECLSKDREALLAFYDFPAEHWVHIRTINPIKSMFATVRLRTDKTRCCVFTRAHSVVSFQIGTKCSKAMVTDSRI